MMREGSAHGFSLAGYSTGRSCFHFEFDVASNSARFSASVNSPPTGVHATVASLPGVTLLQFACLLVSFSPLNITRHTSAPLFQK